MSDPISLALAIGCVSLAVLDLALIHSRRHGLARTAAILLLPIWAIAVFVAEAAPFGDDTIGYQSPIKIIPVAILTALAVYVLSSPPPGSTTSFRAIVRNESWLQWLLVLIGWMSVCALLSAAPGLSLLRVVQTVVPVLAALAVTVAGVRSDRLLLAVVFAAVAHLLIGIINPIYVGPPDDVRLVGILVANSFSLLSALPIVIVLGWLLGGRRLMFLLLIPVAVLGAYAIFESRGRTAGVAAIIASAAVLLATRARSGKVLFYLKPMMFLAMIGISLVVVVEFGDPFWEWFTRGNPSTVSTISGRREIWPTLTSLVLEQQPFTGFGPGAIRLQMVPNMPAEMAALGTAHNSLVEVLVSSGAVGVVLWLGFIVNFCRAAWRLKDPERTVTIGTLVALFVFGVTLATLAGFGVGWYALCALMPAVIRRYRPDLLRKGTMLTRLGNGDVRPQSIRLSRIGTEV